MNSADLNRKLTAFDAGLPLDEASTPPASWYTDADFYQLERETVFRRNWIAAARLDQLRQRGDYVAGNVAGEPYVVVRGDDGQLRAFYNVCRHRATEVASGEGRCEEFTCPYHGWKYGLDGRLHSAPELGAVKNFDRRDLGLPSMAVTTWGPLVWVSLSERKTTPSDELNELETRLDAGGWGKLKFVTRRCYRMACNWKVFVDNYLDGGYHVPYLHRGLGGQLELQSYRTEVFGRYSIQSCTARGGGRPAAAREPELSRGGDFAQRIGEGALYAWIYPNFMINRYGSIMDTNLVLPIGHDQTDVIFDYFFDETQGEPAAEFIEKSLEASDVVQQEDITISQSVQRGLGSASYHCGRYSVMREKGQHHFHRLLAADLADGS